LYSLEVLYKKILGDEWVSSGSISRLRAERQTFDPWVGARKGYTDFVTASKPAVGPTQPPEIGHRKFQVFRHKFKKNVTDEHFS